MTTRPLTLRAPQVRAAQAERLSAVIVPLTIQSSGNVWRPIQDSAGTWLWQQAEPHDPVAWPIKLPFAPGDILWCRETFWHARPYPCTLPSGEPASDDWLGGLIRYAADGDPENTPNRHYPEGLRGGHISAPNPYAQWIKRPSCQMRREFSRLTLIVGDDVQVLQVQDVSEEQAQALGFAGQGGVISGPEDPPEYDWITPREELLSEIDSTLWCALASVTVRHGNVDAVEAAE